VHPREKTTPDNMKAQSHGYVTEVFYNAADGWWYGRGVCDTEEAATAINRYGFCSVGYEVTRTGPGGVWHDIKYAEEILGFSGEHLAIVARPRYEEATIRLNAKENNKPNTTMFKFWKKSASSKPSEANAAQPAAAAETKAATTAATTVENASGASEISPDSEIEITGADGQASKVTLGTLIESHASVENAKKNGVDMDGDDEIRHNGKTYKVNALIEAFDKWERHNAAEEEAKKRENASGKPEEEAKPATNAAAPANRENGKPDHFRVLLGASNRPAPVAAPRDFNSIDERLARGAKMFGSGK
jgi:pyruvate/2-oxoglutarate dehydrogenase complex dihydrolipoamide acyltransferase (E2) component